MNKVIDFSLTSFRIGEAFTGKLKEFKAYSFPLGTETLTKATSSMNKLNLVSGSCSVGFFYDSGSSSCLACPAGCA